MIFFTSTKYYSALPYQTLKNCVFWIIYEPHLEIQQHGHGIFVLIDFDNNWEQTENYIAQRAHVYFPTVHQSYIYDHKR